MHAHNSNNNTTTSKKTPINPLDLPEIPTRVGHFLSLWVVPQGADLIQRKCFQSHTVTSCLLVSKLWLQALAPILWHGYYSLHMGANNNDNTRNGGGSTSLPAEVISRNSHHFRIFESRGDSPGPFYCTWLTKLSLLNEFQARTKMGLDNQRGLVRTNPGIRELYWCGPEPFNTWYEAMKVQDFVVLTGVKDLGLSHWPGGDGSLKKVLMTVAESLQVLDLSVIVNVRMRDIVDEQATQESLGSSTAAPISSASPSPSRKWGPIKTIITRVSGSLRNQCPELSSLALGSASYGDVALTSTLLRDGPVAGRLESLEIAVISFDEDLTSSILIHTSTLTCLQIISYGSFGVDDYDDDDDEDSDDGDTGTKPNPREEMALVLWFLVECRHLRRCMLIARVMLTLEVFCGILSSQPWGCVGLEHLTIETGYSLFVSTLQCGKEEEEEKEEEGSFITKDVAFMGWLLLPREYEGLNQIAAMVEKEHLRMLFELVQGLPSLKTLTRNHIVYTHCNF